MRTAFHRVRLVGIAFAARYLRGEVRLSAENTDYGWFSLEELRSGRLPLGLPIEVLEKGVEALRRLPG